jgi:hypothetical protein
MRRQKNPRRDDKGDPDVSLYQFYNLDKSDSGAVFALCARHRAVQPIPPNCTLQKVGERSLMACMQCANEES